MSNFSRREGGFAIYSRDAAAMGAPHTHPDIEVNFLVGGSVTYLHGGSVVTVEPHRLAVLWAGLPHRTLTAAGTGIWMYIPLTTFLGWALPGNLQARLLKGQLLLGRTDERLYERLEGWRTDYESSVPARRRALLLEVEAYFLRLGLTLDNEKPASRSEPGQVGRIVDYLAHHYQTDLTLERIGTTLGFHPKYLARLFKQTTGMTVLEYVAGLRLAHAQRLLLTSDMSIVDVASDAGFGSLGAFYHAFASNCPGIRPLEYRRLAPEVAVATSSVDNLPDCL